MNLFDQVVLLATGLVAAYLIWRFFGDYQKSEGKATHDIYYMISFAVLLVAGVLLIIFTYDVLSSPWVVIVAALIPLALAMGLVAQYLPEYEKIYLAFVVIGFLLIAVTRFAGPESLKTPLLAVVHGIAGVTIVALPIVVVAQGKTKADFVLVAVGGVLIGLGGMALAFLKSGKQLLFFSEDVVFTILAPLLFLMALAFAWGFVKNIKAGGEG